MAKDINNSKSVDEHIQKLPADLEQLSQAIRVTILGSSKEVGEQIKWNSPSFFFQGEMKDFDAKEYKRDLIVMNIRKGRVLLIFPTGDKIKLNTSILEGKYEDGRRMVTIKNLEDLKNKDEALRAVIKQWLAQVERE
ncbi:MAG: DUF1801 domain-containing protein [Saprospiraceae bacterium]